MRNKPILVLSLILSILSLIYLVLDRQGYIRNYRLTHNSPESYLKNYMSLPKFGKNKVVISVATKNASTDKFKIFLNSILDQTIRVDEIILIIPYKNMNTVSENIKKVVSVHGYSKDYDNAACLICSVLTEPENNTQILIVDPETVYKQDFIEKMLEKSKEHPEKIIYGNINKEIQAGILVKSGFFDDKISNYTNGKGCCPWLEECSKVGYVVI